MNFSPPKLALCIASLLIVLISTALGSDAAPQAVDFNRDVRPILSNNCFHCHGPDPKDRQADLRLDVWKSVGKLHGAEAAIDTQNLAESELVRRITSDDPDVRMPPADSGKLLKPEQIKILSEWVKQ